MSDDDIQVEGEELPHLLLVDDDATFTRVMGEGHEPSWVSREHRRLG
ncbi:helix-turn-helix, Fis-type [Pseudomonas syringae pv. pisi str. 1704B]|uniref:Helix-turn-helix, Fis-type n=1 Tax=Pseudomonas syringae pv. pisi str. 1704B TaxID=629263 RepID=F3GN46_PSESJ|nr:helix-turn-helix, Fis-type [Pseudomonas syringae pv. pisi str. 1704B]